MKSMNIIVVEFVKYFLRVCHNCIITIVNKKDIIRDHLTTALNNY
jgi:hypothetical protein